MAPTPDPDLSRLTPRKRTRRLQRLVRELNSIMPTAPPDGYEAGLAEMVRIAALMDSELDESEGEDSDPSKNLNRENESQQAFEPPAVGQDGRAIAAGPGGVRENLDTTGDEVEPTTRPSKSTVLAETEPESRSRGIGIIGKEEISMREPGVGIRSRSPLPGAQRPSNLPPPPPS